MRTLLHVDMDAFYASVALRDRPDLIDKPVLVGGATRGVVLSATYPARAHGISGGMPMTRARRLCPEAVVLPPDFDAYAETARGIRAIFESVTAVVEAASIDEAFLDITGSLRRLGRPAEIGELIRAKVFDEQGITCSVGIGPAKFVAKLASNAAKPDGLREVTPREVVPFLHQLPVEAMWGVGRPPPKNSTDSGSTRSQSWRTHPRKPCNERSDVIRECCCTIWPGGATQGRW